VFHDVGLRSDRPEALIAFYETALEPLARPFLRRLAARALGRLEAFVPAGAAPASR
jgi:hypothetical protein